MASTLPRALIEVAYEEAAQAYLRSLPPEHFMEATAQATQRMITVESMHLLQVCRPDVQIFNELLVQYPRPRQRRPGQAVPDNMVVISGEPVRADSSFNLPLEAASPFWVMEYVSKHNKRKDYEDSFNKYERALKVPYYLTFYPDNQELTPYRHTGKKYASVKPNQASRYPIQELDLEIGLLDGWVRFWHKGELLSLPPDLQRDLEDARRRAEVEKRRADEQQHRADEQQHRADEQQRRADEETRRAEDEKRRADELQKRLEQIEHELVRFRAAQTGRGNEPKGDRSS